MGCARAVGWGTGSWGQRHPSPPQTGLVWFSKGTRFREVLGKAEECSTGPWGRGQEGSTDSQGFHCVLSTPAGPTVAGSLESSQKNKELRERKDEEGAARSLGERAAGGTIGQVTEARVGGDFPVLGSPGRPQFPSIQ